MNPLDRFLQSGDVLRVAPDGQMLTASDPPRVLLPGSFNPAHRGHLELARVAERILGQPPAFELSVVNVDKPPLTHAEIRRRLAQFAWRGTVWLTRAPRFVDKAECFPGVFFVVGADTAHRIVSARYYDHDEAIMDAALKRLHALECRFLVACRADPSGKCLELDDLSIPPTHRDLFLGISSQHFRWDLSSTELRQRGHGV